MESSPLRLTVLAASASWPPQTSSTRNLLLTSEQRAKTRFRTKLSDGTDAVIVLARGSVMRPGMHLLAEGGEVVVVVAASEQIYRVTARPDSMDHAFDLLRAAYHLGNRHIPVELTPGLLKLERDPVLRDLLLRLGLDVTPAFEAFDPEPGAYGGGHRHDVDDAGGAIGEALSRDAHAMP